MNKYIVYFFLMLVLSTTAQIKAESLLDIYQLAIENDPEIKKLEYDLDMAIADQDIAEGRLLPRVQLETRHSFNKKTYSGLGDASNRNTATSQTVDSVSVGAYQDIFNFESWLGYDISKQKSMLVNTFNQAKKQEFILNIITNYINVLKAIEELKTLEAEKKAVSNQFIAISERYKEQVSTLAEKSLAKAELFDVKARELDSKNKLKAAIDDLYTMTGKNITRINQLVVKKFKVYKPKQTVDSFVNVAIQNNLYLRYYKMQELVAKDGIKLSYSGFYPTLTADVSASKNFNKIKNGGNSSSDLKNRENNLSANLVLTLPLFNGGTDVARVKKQKAEYLSSAQDYNKNLRGIIKNINTAYSDLVYSDDIISTYFQYLAAAKQSLSSVNSSYNLGISVGHDVLDRIKNLYDYERKLSNARYDNILSMCKLRFLQGNLSEKDIMQLNQIFTKQKQLHVFNNRH